jgi:hypothetical protein
MEFDQEVTITRICDMLATTDKGLHKILSTDTINLPAVSQFWRWLRADDALPLEERKGFSRMFAEAKKLQAEFLESQLLEIADEDPGQSPNGFTDGGKVQHNKLRIDTRKWCMARLYSSKYGDRTTLAGDPEAPLGGTAKEDLSKLNDKDLAELIRLRKKLEAP